MRASACERLAALGLPMLVIFGTDDKRWRSSPARARGHRKTKAGARKSARTWNRISMIFPNGPGRTSAGPASRVPMVPIRRINRARITIDNASVSNRKCRSPLLELVIENSLE